MPGDRSFSAAPVSPSTGNTERPALRDSAGDGAARHKGTRHRGNPEWERANVRHVARIELQSGNPAWRERSMAMLEAIAGELGPVASRFSIVQWGRQAGLTFKEIDEQLSWLELEGLVTREGGGYQAGAVARIRAQRSGSGAKHIAGVLAGVAPEAIPVEPDVEPALEELEDHDPAPRPLTAPAARAGQGTPRGRTSPKGKLSEAPAASEVRIRRCRQCGEPGHNARTCMATAVARQPSSTLTAVEAARSERRGSKSHPRRTPVQIQGGRQVRVTKTASRPPDPRSTPPPSRTPLDLGDVIARGRP